MKNTVVYPAALICLLILVQSCEKNYQDSFSAHAQMAPANQYVNASVSSGETFTFIAGSSGTLNVTQQASHYQVSETGTNDNGSVTYIYNSVAGFVGTDEVTLAYTSTTNKSENNSGCPNHTDAPTCTIVINLNVTK
jgi:hypothetical protein